MAEPIACECPHCQVTLKLKNPELAGKKIKCPKCAEPFVVTPKAPASPPAPSPKPVKKPKPKELPADDDWLNDPGLADEGEDRLPPVVGKKKKKTERGEVRARKRSEEGRDIPLAVHYLMMAGTGLVGGLLGAAIWAALIYFTGYEIGYVAIFVGALAGIGVRVGANQWDYGMGPGLTAVAVAILALIAGKVVGYKYALQAQLAEFRVLAEDLTHENYLIAEIAYNVQSEMPEGTPLSPPEFDEEQFDPDEEGFPPEQIPKTFPKEVWAAAQAKWDALPAEERQRQKTAQEQTFDEDFGADASSLFGFYDFLWFLLAISAAYRIATGDDESS